MRHGSRRDSASRQQRTSCPVERVPRSMRRPQVDAGIGFTSQPIIGLRPDVFQWIGVIGTKSPTGDPVVLRVGLVHRLIHRVMLRSAHKLAAIGAPLEEETIHPLGDEQDLYQRHRPTSTDIGQISAVGLGPRIRGGRQYLGTVRSVHVTQPAGVSAGRFVTKATQPADDWQAFARLDRPRHPDSHRCRR
jgi:hypothetical protein